MIIFGLHVYSYQILFKKILYSLGVMVKILVYDALKNGTSATCPENCRHPLEDAGLSPGTSHIYRKVDDFRGQSFEGLEPFLRRCIDNGHDRSDPKITIRGIGPAIQKPA